MGKGIISASMLQRYGETMSTLPILSENALTVLRERYLLRDGSGRPMEDPAAMLRRVASTVAKPARSFGEDAVLWEARFLERLERLEFLPNSPTLMNAGLAGGQLAACFVLCTKTPAAIAVSVRNNPYIC